MLKAVQAQSKYPVDYCITIASCLSGTGCCESAEASRRELLETVTEMASRGLRTLCLAYADVSADEVGPLEKLEGPPQLPLTACCMLGIKVSVEGFDPHPPPVSDPN